MAHKERQIQTYISSSAEPLSTMSLASLFDPSEAALLDISDAPPTRKLSLFDEMFIRSSTPDLQPTTPYRKIGAGACGAVFARGGNSEGLAIKLAKVSDNTELWNDYIRHSTISKHFRRFQPEVSIPECHFFVPKDTPSYFANNPDLSKAATDICHMPTDVLVTERIQPLPQSIRTFLIERFCPPAARESALSDPANDDCLVRVYLGSHSRKPSSGMKFFSLRNFKMHLDQMVDLDLDIETVAKRMGAALAVMHWAARTDARDVEFVLGSSRKRSTPLAVDAEELVNVQPKYTGPVGYTHDKCVCRTTQMWVLDFNQARAVELNEDGVAKMVDAFRLNDPYYPRPLRSAEHERHVWKAFVVSYLQASRLVLEEADEKLERGVFGLPRQFILGVIELERKRLELRRDKEA